MRDFIVCNKWILSSLYGKRYRFVENIFIIILLYVEKLFTGKKDTKNMLGRGGSKPIVTKSSSIILYQREGQ